jgi:hypothetical protein
MLDPGEPKQAERHGVVSHPDLESHEVVRGAKPGDRFVRRSWTCACAAMA